MQRMITFREIERALSPLKRKLYIENVLKNLILGVSIASLVSLLLAYASLIMPITFPIKKILIIYLSIIIGSLVFSLMTGIQKTRLYRIADSLGLRERVITSFYLRKEDGELEQLQRQDTLHHIIKKRLSKIYKMNLKWSYVVMSMVAIVLILISFIIPSTAKVRAMNIEKFKDEVKTQIQRIEKEKKEALEASTIEPEVKAEIEQRISELISEMKTAGNKEQALKAIAKAQNQLRQLENNEELIDLAELGEKLIQNASTKALGEALKAGNVDQFEKSMEALKNSLESISKAERQGIVQSLNKGIEELKSTPELAQGIDELGKAIQEGKLGEQAAEEFKQVSEMIQEIAKQDAQFAEAIKQFNQQMSQSLKQAASGINKSGDNQSAGATADNGSQGNSSSNTGQGSSGTQGASGAQTGNGTQGSSGSQGGSNTQGSNGGQGGSNAQGASGSNGNSGAGGSEGMNAGGVGSGTGSGAGSGSTNTDMGYSEADGSGKRNQGEKQIKDYEEIYVPTRVGGDNEISQVKGTKGDSGDSQWTQVDKLPVAEGEILPYNQVYTQYRNDAMSAIQGETIPPVMKEIVKEYFSQLE